MRTFLLVLLFVTMKFEAAAQVCPCDNLLPSRSEYCSPCQEDPLCGSWQSLPSMMWGAIGDTGTCHGGRTHRWLQPSPAMKYRLCNGRLDICLTGSLWTMGAIGICSTEFPPCNQDPSAGLALLIQTVIRLGQLHPISSVCPRNLNVNVYYCIACGPTLSCGARRCMSTFDVCFTSPFYSECNCDGYAGRYYPLSIEYNSTTAIEQCPPLGPPCTTNGCTELDAWLRCYFP